MIVGVGIDVVDVERFGQTLERTPGLLDRLVQSILGGGSADDSGTVHPKTTPVQQPVPIWKNKDANDARKSK